tara:strand:+ start:489 stop:698 length:210 start_codon:yes stop_codon:yes gene_type:complete
MKKTKTKKDLKKERENLMTMKQKNLDRIKEGMSSSSRMSHGEMKKLLEGVKVFKKKINDLDKKIGDEKA